MRLFQILAFHTDTTGAFDRRRLWVDVGVPCVIGPGLYLTAYFSRVDSKQVLNLSIRTDNQAVTYIVPPEFTLTLDRLAGLRVTPVAVEYTPQRRPLRLRLDFVSVRASVRFVS